MIIDINKVKMRMLPLCTTAALESDIWFYESSGEAKFKHLFLRIYREKGLKTRRKRK